LLRPSMRRTVNRGEARMRRHEITAEVVTRASGRELWLLPPTLELAHRERCWLTSRPCLLDDAEYLAGWRMVWRAAAAAGRLEISRLMLSVPRRDRPVMAAYCMAIRDRPQRTWRVLLSEMVTAWQDVAPGRVLESRLIDREQADPGTDVIDWGPAQYLDKLIAVSP
jgi:hypothetical protein